MRRGWNVDHDHRALSYALYDGVSVAKLSSCLRVGVWQAWNLRFEEKYEESVMGKGKQGR
jgi:hypothetical protein